MTDGRAGLNATAASVALGLVGILGFVTWALVFRELPKANEPSFTLLIGILSTNVGLIIGFFFGSSAASARKDSTIDAMAKTAQAAGIGGDPGSIVLKPGEQATATATDAGTVITPTEPNP